MTNKKESDTWRTPKDLEIVKAFLYNDNSLLQVHVYDKKTKMMFAGAIHGSSYTRKEMLALDNPTAEHYKKDKKDKGTKFIIEI